MGYIYSPFERSGLAARSDLLTQEWLELFHSLEKEQEIFLIHEDRFRSPGYKWPRDPLHTWSRVWEYPYVYHHLKIWRAKFSGGMPLVVDLGSGVTFFPFTLARLGCSVTCVDIDEVCKMDLACAAQCVLHEPGKVDFQLSDGHVIPFKDEEVDGLYSISVLEHISTLENTVEEIARVLKPGGLFILTIDLSLRNDVQLGVDPYQLLMKKMMDHFDFLYPEIGVHPADMLNSLSGPYALEKLKGLELFWFILKQHVVKPILGLKPHPRPPLRLAVFGAVFIKKRLAGF